MTNPDKSRGQAAQKCEFQMRHYAAPVYLSFIIGHWSFVIWGSGDFAETLGVKGQRKASAPSAPLFLCPFDPLAPFD